MAGVLDASSQGLNSVKPLMRYQNREFRQEVSAEHCARIGEALQSKKLSAEHCAKIGKTLKEEMQ